MPSRSLLSLSNVKKYFGGVRAVDGVSFSVNKGEIVGLIGPNGSGKSTLFNVVSGVYSADGGEIYFEGERIDGLQPYDRFSKGLVRSFQNPSLFFGMTTIENTMIPPRNQVGEVLSSAPFHGKWLRQERDLSGRALDTLKSMQLVGVGLNRATEVSGGQMKLLELSRAMMGEPRLMLLDEPTAGVAPKLAVEIFDMIRTLRDESRLTFVIIEHRLEILFDYVQRVLVMNQGQIIADGNPETVSKDAKVIDAYLGE